MKFGSRGFSRVLISKIASIFTWKHFFEVCSWFLGSPVHFPKSCQNRKLDRFERMFAYSYDWCSLCMDWSNLLLSYTKYTNPMTSTYATSGPATGTPVAYVFSLARQVGEIKKYFEKKHPPTGNSPIFGRLIQSSKTHYKAPKHYKR